MSSLPSEVFRRWVHSHEEDSDDTLVYRTEEYDFPMARGRRAIELRWDGGFIQYDIGPDDRWREVPGRWTAKGPGRVRVEFSGSERPPYTLRIVACDGAVLKVRRETG